MGSWQLVSAANVALTEYKHKRAVRHTWFTEDNLKLLLLAINIVRVVWL